MSNCEHGCNGCENCIDDPAEFEENPMSQQTQEQDRQPSYPAAFIEWAKSQGLWSVEFGIVAEWSGLRVAFKAWQAASAQAAPTVVTEEMHVAACKVLTRANGMAGLPQRMLDAMLAVAAQTAPVDEKQASSEQRENMAHLGGMRYLVWTQAGFTKARKHVLAGDEGYYRHRSGYPQSYPSVVTFEEGYEGYRFYDAICTPMGREIERLKSMATRLEQLDADHARASTQDSPL